MIQLVKITLKNLFLLITIQHKNVGKNFEDKNLFSPTQVPWFSRDKRGSNKFFDTLVHHESSTSVTKTAELFFNLWPFITMKIWPMALKFRHCRFIPSKIWSWNLKILANLRNFVQIWSHWNSLTKLPSFRGTIFSFLINVIFTQQTRSATRFGEISPLWENRINIWQVWGWI